MTTRNKLAARLASYGLILVWPALGQANTTPRQPTTQNPQAQVIHRSPGSVSTETYFQKLKLPNRKHITESLRMNQPDLSHLEIETRFNKGLKKLIAIKESQSPEKRFPLRTDLVFANATILENPDITHPFFFIGLDKYSLNWLERHHHHLVRVNAQGFIVAGDQYSDYKLLTTYADEVGLSLAVLPADQVATNLGVDTYPSLVVPVITE